MFATITFNADGAATGTLIDDDGEDETFSGTWAVVGNVLTVTYEGESVTGPYGVNGNEAVFETTHKVDSVNYDIKLKLRRS